MSTDIVSELLQPVLKTGTPCERIYGRDAILHVYGAMREICKHSSRISLPSAANTRSLLSWNQAPDTLAETNEEFQKNQGSLALVEAGWLETVTQNGTEHEEWARGICNRPHNIVYQLPYVWTLGHVFGSHLSPRDSQGWEWVAFPDCNVLFLTNCTLNDGGGVMDVIRLPQVVALTATRIADAAETLGHPCTYPELFTRCFGYALDTKQAA